MLGENNKFHPSIRAAVAAMRCSITRSVVACAVFRNWRPRVFLGCVTKNNSGEEGETEEEEEEGEMI